MDEQLLSTELQKFNVTDAAISELSSKYMGLKIDGIDDKKGAKAVHEALMDVKGRRVAVQKIGKELRADAIKYQNAVIAEEKRIIALLEPIEDHLTEEEEAVKNEIARIKAEEEAKASAKIQARIDCICDIGAQFNGKAYISHGVIIPDIVVRTANDEQFADFIAQIREAKSIEEERIKAEEEARKAEEERLRKIAEEQERIRAEQEAAAAKLREEQERIKREQEEAARKIREEQEAIEKEKARIAKEEADRQTAIELEAKRKEEERVRQEEIEKARKEAEERAVIEAKEKAEREAVEKAEADLKAKIEAERQEALKPDKEKLLSFADTIETLVVPEMKDPKAQAIIDKATSSLCKVADAIRKELRTL